jgi:hypothetical protein
VLSIYTQNERLGLNSKVKIKRVLHKLLAEEMEGKYFTVNCALQICRFMIGWMVGVLPACLSVCLSDSPPVLLSIYPSFIYEWVK